MGKFSAVGKVGSAAKRGGNKVVGKAAGVGAKGAGKVSKGLDKAIAKRDARAAGKAKKRNVAKKLNPTGQPKPAPKPSRAARAKGAVSGKGSQAVVGAAMLGERAGRGAKAAGSAIKSAPGRGAKALGRGKDIARSGPARSQVAQNAKTNLAARADAMSKKRPTIKGASKKRIAGAGAAVGGGGYVTYKRRTKSGKVVTVRRKRG